MPRSEGTTLRALSARALRRLGHLYPLVSGCGRVGNAGPMVWASRGLAGPAKTWLRDGSIALVDPADQLGRALYFTGDWDPKITWVCKALLRPGDVALDIGAHCGVVALSAAHSVGPKGQVHAFEPNPNLSGLLRQSAQLNGYDQLHLHEVALGDTDGQAELHMAHGHTFFGSLARRLDVPGESLTIETREALAYIEKLDLPHVRLIKLDVEGYEGTVIRALRKFFERQRADAVLVETDDFESPYWEREAVRAMTDLGYQMIGLPQTLWRVRPVRTVVGIDPQEEFHDSLAVSAEAYDQVCESLGVV